MPKHIVIKATPCANAKDVVQHICNEYGHNYLEYSEEFKKYTGGDIHSFSKMATENLFKKTSDKILTKSTHNLLSPSVILVYACTVPNEVLRRIGYLYQLELSDYDPIETAEYIFNAASEHYYTDECLETESATILAA